MEHVKKSPLKQGSFAYSLKIILFGMIEDLVWNSQNPTGMFTLNFVSSGQGLFSTMAGT